MSAARKPLYYTFGNHKHWVDFTWLWGPHVLPASTRDMLRFCAEAGVRGNVDFEAYGYERMAVECPDALAELRAAVEAGTIEPVGASFGQPYALFQGGESNVRQFTHGVRATLRHIGFRPRAFWEEEFYFYPQLPQVLAGCGYTGACLFFQWTWHTPEVPREEHALIQWEGLDGTRLFALPRNALCLHQWPEDFEPMLASELLESLERPALVQWIELLPSPDWMCRSEVLLPEMKRLAADERFELRPRTLSRLIEELAAGDAAPPVCRYSMDEVWHGLTLGKNADFYPRASLRIEATLLAAEALASVAGLLGRPYPSWDVYPSWEVEESWRELLLAQHHDNHECEGLCGFIGHDQLDRAERMGKRVLDRSLRAIARRLDPEDGEWVVANALGWERDVHVDFIWMDVPEGAKPGIAPAIPAFGYRQLAASELRPVDPCDDEPFKRRNPGPLTLESTGWSGSVSLAAGLVRDGERVDLFRGDVETEDDRLSIRVTPHPVFPAVLELSFYTDHWKRFDPGLNAALALELTPDPLPGEGFEARTRLLHDHPYGTSEVRADADRQRKYPSGDWMTSEQWFETTAKPFTALSFVDLCDARSGDGLLLVHDGSQSWQRTEGGVRVVLNAIDPWDEEYWNRRLIGGRLWFCPHGSMSHLERQRLAAELRAPCVAQPVPPDPISEFSAGFCVGGGSLEGSVPPPREFGAVRLEGAALLTAFHRENARSGDGLPDWAGHRMEAPHVVRLAEWDGRRAPVSLSLAGEVASAWRTNLLGEKVERLDVALEADGRSRLALELGPHEIATVMVDLVLGRKVSRDLDAKRKVWATVHREQKG